MASIQEKIGEYDTAKDILDEVLALKEELYGSESLDVGDMYYNLGGLLEHAQKPEKAKVSTKSRRNELLNIF